MAKDEAQGSGAAPPKEGGGIDLNPHIPAFMVKAPWYMDTGKTDASLVYQRKPGADKREAGLDDWYQRGATAGQATRYRKGACENCGAMSHKTRDCLERPRKRGAKWTGKDIRPDEVVQTLDKDFSFDAKRDRWNGYDPAMHREVVRKHEAIEEERRRLREAEIDQRASTGLSAAKKIAKQDKKPSRASDDDFDSSSSDDDDDDKYAEKASMVGQARDGDQRMTVRNLRIREDRAKYLYDLSLDSAEYDPKTRSMRAAPLGNGTTQPDDAFERSQRDEVDMQKLQLFAWQSEARGSAAHLQANPTVNELQFKEYQQKKEQHLEETRTSLLERYGGAEHLKAPPRELLVGQTEHYAEYSPSGEVIRGQPRATPRSRYEEDVYDTNHTAVWGSFYDLATGAWGYRCCHNTMYRSYCTGKAGIEAARASAPAQT
ncbi:mRNA splicing protein [Malassezia brasiliensis]|uniref:Pre-mRNA-splicing factor SLU7 n=1 Tax=Malassezia brasiliensis TaxID=1821822 RepID=A0AAF0E098_9BASI|nr:mRNA splicing protein [Malassezia brasiliensis]